MQQQHKKNHHHFGGRDFTDCCRCVLCVKFGYYIHIDVGVIFWWVRFLPFFCCCLFLILLRSWYRELAKYCAVNFSFIILFFLSFFFHGQWKRLSTVGKSKNWVSSEWILDFVFCCWCCYFMNLLSGSLKSYSEYTLHINWCLSIK